MNATSPTLSLTTKELHIVQGLLRVYLPSGSKAWVFGSRAKGAPRPASDLDLAVDAGPRLEFGIVGVLKDSFDVAPLPFNVDLIDLHDISPEFRARIDAHKIALPGFE
ncbi:nucleotidyltransferase family protein [Acidocella sp.]|uniref:nucleotidyltransferase family protein n=1 Tax=Acidocella sp. TaxID=50710 RepID=UPI002627AED4|nr:nucleotidyltransferase domain-containing protein [Acidocella sp.]